MERWLKERVPSRTMAIGLACGGDGRPWGIKGIQEAGEQGDPLLEGTIEHGDKAVALIWRNNGALTMTAVLGTFVANPKPCIDEAADLVGKPLEEAARNTQ